VYVQNIPELSTSQGIQVSRRRKGVAVGGSMGGSEVM